MPTTEIRRVVGVLIAIVSSLAIGAWYFQLADASQAGDVNCDATVNSIDAALVLQANAGLIVSLPCQDGADVNRDGTANALDALFILQFSAGLIKSLEARPTTIAPTPTVTPGVTVIAPTPTVTPGVTVLDYSGTFAGGTVSFTVAYNCLGGACLSETQVNRFSAERTGACLQSFTALLLPVIHQEFFREQPSSVVTGAGYAVSGVLGPSVEPPVAAAEAIGTVSFYGCELYDIPWTASVQ
jgi:hypothetical protein